MRNIIKAQFFQIMREKIIWYMLLLAFLMQVLMFMLPIWLKNEEATTAGAFFATNGSALIFFPLFFLVVATGQICGVDFLDKTNNYELMSGHRRYEVYFGRIIPAVLVGGLGTAFLTVVPVVLYTSLYGWGAEIALSDAVLRLVLMLFPILRLVCEFAFLTFLVKNPYVMMGVGYGLFMATIGLTEQIRKLNAFLGITNMMLLLDEKKGVTFGTDGTPHFIYEASLGGDVIWQTILASVVFGGAALYLGYVYFKNNDLN